jgi:hypothetical protein
MPFRVDFVVGIGGLLMKMQDMANIITENVKYKQN